MPKEGKIEKMPPMLSLSESDLGEIKDWKVGNKYKILLDVEQVSMSKDDMMDIEGGNGMHARFKVLSAKASNSEKKSYSSKAVEMATEKAE